MNETRNLDYVTGLIFTITAACAVFGAWYRKLRVDRAYSRYGARHQARRFPLQAQLRLTVLEEGRVWSYATTW